VHDGDAMESPGQVLHLEHGEIRHQSARMVMITVC
jgi:hypothetical protein